MPMPTHRRAARVTAAVFAALAIAAAGLALAGSAAAAEQPPQNPVTRAVFDAVAPVPEQDANEFSDSERLAGLLGLNEDPGGPLGWWPRPANPNESQEYGAIPGTGPYGDLAGILGVTPRTPYTGGHTDSPDKLVVNPAPGPALCGAPAECAADLVLVPVNSLAPPTGDDAPGSTTAAVGPGRRIGTAVHGLRFAAAQCVFPVDCLLDVVDPPHDQASTAPAPVAVPTEPKPAPSGHHRK